MRIFLKILKITAILIALGSIILFSASLFLQKSVADIILKSLNDNITTKLDIGDFRLSFLRKFPRASLELKNVLVHSSPSFDTTGFTGVNTDTLLASGSVSVEFSIRDIIKGKYTIDRIGIKSGRINLLSDSAGNVNYEIKSKKETEKNSEFEVNLERVNLSNISTTYYNRATNLLIQGEIKSSRLKSKVSENIIDFSANSSVHIALFQLYTIRITKGIDADLDISLHSSDSATLFRKSTMKLDDFVFGLEGTVSKNDILDLKLNGQNIDISRARKYLPDKLRLAINDYDPSGVLKVNGTIKGLLSRTVKPHIEIIAALANGHIKYGKSDLSVEDLSFTGFFSNGTKNLPVTSSVSLNDISLKLGSSVYNGSFIINNFTHPLTSIFLTGTLKPAELKEFFDLQSISHTGGSIDSDLKLRGEIIRNENFSVTDLLKLNPEGDLNFKGFSLEMGNGKFTINDVNGKVNFSGIVTADSLQLTYKDHIIMIDGEFQNLPEWLAGRNVQMSASANVTFNRFFPGQLFQSSNSNPASLRKRIYSLPENIVLDINFNIDTLQYKTFHGEKITGVLSYKPGIINFKSLSLNSLGGIISGNGIIAQNVDKSIITKGSFNLKGIDINSAFTSFNNFGQTFMKAENLTGTLSGSVSLLLPMDSLLKPEIKSLTAEGKYIVTKGTLVNFDPVKKLSSYIELSELENISFDKFENDFFIRNDFLYIPQMDVRSSAVDLSVNGRHSFDNNYEYHVKMLLSEILSKKVRKNKKNNSEFGIIEDDGLGRTSLLLKIENKGNDVKVGYDIKAAGSEIKNNIKAERQSLKAVLKEEFGWFKNDSSVKKTKEKRPRFRITWDERGDSVRSIPEVPAEKKSNPVKNLFKKK